MSSNKVTMADVAEKAGVSKSTVSQYLNKRYEYMGADTKKKIEQAIEELEYRPNVLARSLKQKRTSTIGVIAANIMHSFSTEICRAIEDYFQEHEINVILCNTDEDAEKEKRYIEMLQAKQADGIILFPTGKNNVLYKKLAKQQTPILFVDRKVEGIGADTIVANNETAVFQAIGHLAEQGHTKIAIVTAPLSISTRIERMEGYRKAVEKLGLERHPEFMIHCEIGRIRGKLQQLFAGADKPTAILAGNDLVMLEILAFVKERRIRIPDELALVVFDNIRFADLLTPTLTTISQPSADMGRTAGKLLHERIQAGGQAEQTPRELVFECKLIVRESSSTHPKK